jgi:PIN domain nuclease of toxin-antitoxin system
MTRRRYLLDTHTFLWLKLDPSEVSTPVLEIAYEPECEINLSAVTCWEISIKYQLGKIKLPVALAANTEQAAIESGF